MNFAVEKFGGKIYEGVAQGLHTLSERVPLFIVSNCQSGYIETFLKFSGFTELFKDFECWGNTRKSKTENLAQIISRNNLKRPVFVGDTEGDRIAARGCQIPFHYMRYGFGKVEDFDAAFSSFAELSDCLLLALRN